MFDAACQLGAHRFHGPAPEIFVDVTSGGVQVSLRKIHAQHAIAYHAGARDYNGENFLISKSREINVLKGIARSAGRDRDPHVPGDQRQNVRSTFHELLHVRDSLE